MAGIAGQGMGMLKSSRLHIQLFTALRTATGHLFQGETLTPSLAGEEDPCDECPYTPGCVWRNERGNRSDQQEQSKDLGCSGCAPTKGPCAYLNLYDSWWETEQERLGLASDDSILSF
mgnify:CR=1 FL=1|tara:strand:- start:1397 stop:1750 length:354 start_codon:yes stop_codon:yes gene_type:complete